MALTESTMLALGTPAPDFHLPDVVSGKELSLADFGGTPGLLVMFVSRHCPYVQHIKTELGRLGGDYAGRLSVAAICSNNVETHPADAPASLRELAAEAGWNFAVCYDESQDVAKSYEAACTPDFFLFDAGRRLAYRGQLDDSRPGNGKPVTGADLRAAIEQVLAGKPVAAAQKPSVGCNIKWKPGNEPRQA